jgi:photosystem II stability/assembly factor-like uncharacterized protein
MRKVNFRKNIDELLVVVIWSAFLFVVPQVYADWDSGGPSGGNVNSMAMAATNPDILYAGTDRGIFKSIDGGSNWTKTGFSEALVRAVQVAPNNADIVYAGTDFGGPPVPTDDGIYKSEDGGTTWTPKGLTGARVNAIVIDPGTPNTIFAGTGKPESSYAGEIVGLFKSIDGGDSWQEILSEEGLDAVVALLIDADDSSYIYAGVYPWGSGPGLRISPDGGLNWASKQVGPSSFDEVVALAMNPRYEIAPGVFFPAKIYAIVWGEDVYWSSNRGETWNSTSAPRISLNSPWALTVDPHFPFDVYLGTKCDFLGCSEELYKNAYGVWSEKGSGLPLGAPSSIVIDPGETGIIYAGLSEGGVYKSTDSAENWSISSQGMNGTYITRLAVDSIFSDTLFAAIYGDVYHLATTGSGGSSWDYLDSSPTGLGAVAINPQNSSILIAGDGSRRSRSFYIHKSLNGGLGWTDIEFLYCSSYCVTGVSEILIDVNNSDHILVGTSGYDGVLARTTNGGLTWQQIGFSTSALAVDPSNPNVVYQGKMKTGQVFRYSNVWGAFVPTNITPPAGIGDVWDIVVDTNSRVFVAASDGLWRWNGSEWTTLSGLPSSIITAVTIDNSTAPGTIFAGTANQGVFVSQGSESNWAPFNDALGNLAITELVISGGLPKILYAGTAYGGVWRHALDACQCDFDGDSDVDGSDLVEYILDDRGLGLNTFAMDFGKDRCSQD